MVFLSHSRADQELADAVREKLRSAGAEVWAPEDQLAVGANLIESINDALQRSDVAVILLSDAAQAGSWTSMEQASAVSSAISRGTPHLLPVLAEPGAHVPPILSEIQYADASRPETREAALNSIVDAVARAQQHPAFPDRARLAQSLDTERLLLASERHALQLERGARWEGVNRAYGIGLVASMGAVIIGAIWLGEEILQLLAPVLTALVASAIGFYFGGARGK